MMEACDEPWSNVDELDLRDVSDCHINNDYVKTSYLAILCITCVLFCMSSHKIYLSVKVRKFDINYIPHLCCFCFWGYSAIQFIQFTYKYLAFKKMADMTTMGTLLHAVGPVLFFPGSWCSVLYLMGVSLSAEIGSKGAVLMAKLNRQALVLGGSSCFLYSGNLWLLLIGNEMLRPVSYVLMLNFAYLCICLGSCVLIYGHKVDALLTKVIDSSVELQQKMDKDKAKGKVRSVIKNRRFLRIGVVMIVGGAGVPTILVALASLLINVLAENSWIITNAIFFMGSGTGITLLSLVNTAPPNNRTTSLLFRGGRNRMPSTGRRDSVGGALSLLEKAGNRAGRVIKRHTKRMSVAMNKHSYSSSDRSRGYFSTRKSVLRPSIRESDFAESSRAITSEADPSLRGCGSSHEKVVGKKKTKKKSTLVFVDSKPEASTDAQPREGGAQEEEKQQSAADQEQETTAQPTGIA